MRFRCRRQSKPQRSLHPHSLTRKCRTYPPPRQFAEFVRKLAAQAKNPTDWENQNLPDFLEALAAWVDDMDGYFNNQGLPTPGQPSWELVGKMLAAATIYE